MCPLFLLSISTANAAITRTPVYTPRSLLISVSPEHPFLMEFVESPDHRDSQSGSEEQKLALQPTAANQVGIRLMSPAQQLASVSGAVLDATGGTVSGAEVALKEIDGPESHSAVTGGDGKFAFHELPAGSYIISVKIESFQEYTSMKFILAAHQDLEIPSIILSIAATSSAMVVQPTDVIAAEQMKAEEKQRILGVIPDFYTSYVWNAAALNTHQKFSMSVRYAFDPVTIIGVSLTAGIEQSRNKFSAYGQGAKGYGKRWGARFADGVTYDFFAKAAFPSLLHQDPRYFYQGSGSTWSRIGHAISYAFIARSDRGRLMPNYSTFLGGVCSGALSNLYYPASSRGAGLVFANAAIGLAERAGENLVREFIYKRLTKHMSGNGKPASGSENR